MHPDPDASPFNSLPPAVIVLAAVIFGVEMLFVLSKAGLFQGGTAGVDATRTYAIQHYGFWDTAFAWMVENRRWPLEHVIRFVTYPFVHYNFTHMVFVMVFVLALGKMVGEAFNSLAVLIIFFVSSIVGALAYGLILNDPSPLVGGYPGAYGLIGGFTLILWIGYGRVGANQYRAFTLIGFLVGMQFIFGLMGASNRWLSELSGFAAGFLTAILMVPGSVRFILHKIRNR